MALKNLSNQDHKSAQPAPNRKPIWESAFNLGGAVFKAGLMAGKTAATIGINTVRTGKAVIDSTLGIGKTATRSTVQWVERSTQGAGHAVTLVGNLPFFKNPFVRRIAGVLRLDWLVNLTNQVDFDQTEAEVRQLQQQYPHESPSQIAHRIMVKKAIRAGSIGFASSVLPGVAAALFAIDLAATTAMQTEMVYEIAAAYGLDVRDPARKGEILGIFGLALGGRNALKAGLGFMRNVPLAGALIGAGTNATMLYSLGYAACRFYEAKLQEASDEPTTETLVTIQKESEKYLAVAIAQQAVVDQILVHMILASYPEKTWEQILPELQALQLDSNSLATIAANIKSPEPLGALLNQLNRDFAIPLLAQCRHIAASNGDVSAQETEVLEAIAEKAGTKV